MPIPARRESAERNDLTDCPSVVAPLRTPCDGNGTENPREKHLPSSLSMGGGAARSRVPGRSRSHERARLPMNKRLIGATGTLGAWAMLGGAVRRASRRVDSGSSDESLYSHPWVPKGNG